MDYEQKYKDALEKLQNLHDDYDTVSTLIDIKEELENIFPELKESKDKRIREKRDKSAMKAIKEENIDNVNKVKPKFKVGDWITNGYRDICLITDIDLENDYYICESNRFGNTDGDIDLTDKAFHLWSIQDAKDGDVLAYVTDEEDLWIMIYQSLYEPYEGHVHYHALLANDDFYDKGTCCICIDGLKPATKEQREILFSKMKDAGYEFDFEKKELKKFPNALEECEIEHIEHGKYYYCIKDYYSGGCKRASKGEVVQALRGKSMMALGAEANKYFIPVKCIVGIKPAWSEEDEKMVKDIIAAIDTLYYHGMVNWLKSLKDRVQPQNMWKPSKEQIIALRWVLNNIPYNKHKEEISGLLDQIKML